MVDLCDQNVVDRPFSWHGTRSVYLGWGLLDYFRHPDAPPVKKWSKKPRPILATLLWWAGAGKIYRAPSAFDGFG